MNKKRFEQRVHDIYAGACGKHQTDDDFPTLEEIENAVGALRSWLRPFIEKSEYPKRGEWIWDITKASKFEHPKAATEFLCNVLDEVIAGMK